MPTLLNLSWGAALDRHGQSYLDSMRDAWQDAEAQHQARLQWPPAVLEELDTALAGVVQVWLTCTCALPCSLEGRCNLLKMLQGGC